MKTGLRIIADGMDAILSHESAPEFCALCGSPDNDKDSDHLRHCYKLAQDKLSSDMF